MNRFISYNSHLNRNEMNPMGSGIFQYLVCKTFGFACNVEMLSLENADMYCKSLSDSVGATLTCQ